MNILLLCNKSPYPPGEGGPIAMNMMAEGLIRAGHRVRILAMNTNKYFVRIENIPAGYRAKTRIELVTVDLRIRPFRALLSLMTGQSYHVQRFSSPAFRSRLTEILKEEAFDIIQFEMLYTAPYLETARKYSKAVMVFRAHNIEHMIWERIAGSWPGRLKKVYLRMLARSLKKYELGMIGKFDGIAAITENDAGFFRRYNPNVRAIPFGIDLTDYADPQPGKGTVTLFSIGAMNWIPNTEGIRWFLEKCWPDISNQFPALKFHIAGRAMPDWLKNITQKNVVIEGEVADAREFMKKNTIMIVPLFSGSGIRIKIIEGMASGKTIISTTIGAEGINYTDRENILIANEPCEFFEMISICLDDPTLCERIGRNAAQMIREHYNRDALIGQLTGLYKNIGAE